MRVPLQWLKKYVNPTATAEEIAIRLTMGGLEVEGIENSEIGAVLDVYVTPNRGDCLSMTGVAREVAALYNCPLQIPSPPPSNSEGETSLLTSVSIDSPELCPRYAVRLISGVKIGPSPTWMQAELEAADVRPINNVVDTTNYVMLELGQPLHAFDRDKLTEGRIVVRRARAGEKIATLDGIDRELSQGMLVIADAVKAVAVAGVMGGSDTEVTDNTRNILLESAHFNPLTVRRTANQLGMKSEARYRFERTVDPDGVCRALDRACQLLAEMGQPNAIDGIIDIYPHPIHERTLTLRIARASQLLGMEITSHIAADSLRLLGFDVLTEPHGVTDTLLVRVPSFRSDILIEEDLVEEIGRIYGYENIPETLPLGATTQGGDSAEGVLLMEIKCALSAAGLQEVVTHSLCSDGICAVAEQAQSQVSIRNAQSSDVSRLRSSLLPGMLEVAQNNAARGRSRISIFETGRIWHVSDPNENVLPVETISIAGLLVGPISDAGWHRSAISPSADFSLARGILERLLKNLHIDSVKFIPLDGRANEWPQFHPGRSALMVHNGIELGIVGELHPYHATKSSLRDRVYLFEISFSGLRDSMPEEGPRYEPISRFPAVTRDLAPRISELISYSEVEESVEAAEIGDILEEMRLTDVYRGDPLPDGVKSLTLSFTFRSVDKTLTEMEINSSMEAIRMELEIGCGATFAA